MTAPRGSPTSRAAFEARYEALGDPWHFADSRYELDRYARILEGLSKSRYRAAFEPGCSIGELTARLAERCDALIATDIASAAVRRASRRCARLSQVTVQQRDLCEEMPAGPFDLIVFSEIGYYFDRESLAAIAQGLRAALCLPGELVAVHWLGHSEDHVLHGDEVHEVLASALQLDWVRGMRCEGFRMDTWMRR